MSLPANLKYTDQHEWLDLDGDVAKVGVTAFAADALGDVVYVDLPAVGATLKAGEPCGEIESTKSVSDLYAPCDGEVVEVNDGALDDASQINTDPFGAGWLFKVRVSGTPDLLDVDAYTALTVEAS